jgi:hypothetical protein
VGISLPITTADILILKQYPLNIQNTENVSLEALKLLMKATALLLKELSSYYISTLKRR